MSQKYSLFLFVVFCLVSCKNQPDAKHTIAVTQTPAVTSTATLFPTPTPMPKIWATPNVKTELPANITVPIPRIENSALFLDIASSDDEKPFPKHILSLNQDKFLACGTIEVSYSPTYEHFLVVFHCFEGINYAYLFRTDNGQGREITGSWDPIHSSYYSWSPNGQSIVYYRLSNCCGDLIPELPGGLVLYSIPTGNRLFLSRISDLANFPRSWSPDGAWFPYTYNCKIFLASSDGYNLWEIDNVSDCSEDGYFEWENNPTDNTLVLSYSSDNLDAYQTYIISQTKSAPPTNSAIPVSLDRILVP